jgi:eukaryotic-like serine/threonine-protein kinase
MRLVDRNSPAEPGGPSREGRGMTGRTVSHYRVLDRLGIGGMGIVYRAEDQRLGRAVALKFLPLRLSRHSESLERFRREARVASAINHPHICTIYDIDEHEGHPFIVMELLEGMTLKQLISRRSLEPERLLDLAMQIAEALEAAHARGIIHRDIKPANVFVSRRDQVKVLDFGLAKLMDERGPVVPESDSDDATGWERDDAVTDPGVPVGTLAYMSPEQARGEVLDARSDLFSFGAVLYEMATGQRAFPGTVPALLFDLLLNRAPVSPLELNPLLPPELERIVDKALEKDRTMRYQGAADMLADLRRLRRTLESGNPMSPTPRASHSAPEPPESAPDPVACQRGRRKGAIALTVMLVALALTATAPVSLVGTKPRALSERDSIVLADFANSTDEPVFDLTLRQGLAAQLGQSPFLSIVPDERVRQTLRLMGRTPDDRLNHDAALEVCRRQGIKAMLAGSIASLGRHYVVALDATNCQTGEAIAREQMQVESKERVLRAVGKMASRMRGTLGESLASIQQFDTPIEQITTPSLEALRAFTLGQRQRARGEEIESITFFLRATELDPNFASAYTSLSNVYSNLGEADRAKTYAQLAYERREHVSERERLFITFQYHDRVTGDQSRATPTLEVWKQTFPRDFQPVNSLAFIHNFLGRFERAIEEGQEAVKRNPSHGFPYSNLAFAYRGVGRFDDARRTAERAVALHIETLPTRRLLYQLAVVAGDRDAAARHIDWAKGKLREFDIVGARAQVAAHSGSVREARQLYGETIRMAELRNLPDVATGYLAQAAWMELTYGNTERAVDAARRVLARKPSDTPRLRAALTLAATGSIGEAEAIASDSARTNPEHTMVNAVLGPIVKAGIELGRKRPERAIEQLRIAEPYEKGFAAALAPMYLRGQAYLMQGSGYQAAVEFQRVLDHRGVDPFSPFHAMASLGLARANAMAGNVAGSQQAYERFLAEWAEADPDVPVLLEAREEYRRLTRGVAPAAGPRDISGETH